MTLKVRSSALQSKPLHGPLPQKHETQAPIKCSLNFMKPHTIALASPVNGYIHPMACLAETPEKAGGPAPSGALEVRAAAGADQVAMP